MSVRIVANERDAHLTRRDDGDLNRRAEDFGRAAGWATRAETQTARVYRMLGVGHGAGRPRSDSLRRGSGYVAKRCGRYAERRGHADATHAAAHASGCSGKSRGGWRDSGINQLLTLPSCLATLWCSSRGKSKVTKGCRGRVKRSAPSSRSQNRSRASVRQAGKGLCPAVGGWLLTWFHRRSTAAKGRGLRNARRRVQQPARRLACRVRLPRRIRGAVRCGCPSARSVGRWSARCRG